MCRSVVRWQRCYSHPTSSARTVSRSVSLLGTFFTFFVPCRRGMHLPVQEFADEAVSIDGDDSLKDRPRGSILSFRRMAHVAKHKKSVLVLHKGHCVVFLSGSFLQIQNVQTHSAIVQRTNHLFRLSHRGTLSHHQTRGEPSCQNPFKPFWHEFVCEV